MFAFIRIDARRLMYMQPFDATFGKSKQRKRPRLTTDSLSELLTATQSTTDEYVGLPTPLTSRGYNPSGIAWGGR